MNAVAETQRAPFATPHIQSIGLIKDVEVPVCVAGEQIE